MSSKIAVLLDGLAQLPKCTKSLVFSQWTSLLSIVEPFLDAAGVQHVRLDGQMTMDERDGAVESFRHDPDVSVFLLSLKAGGVGLHLVEATHVWLLDPWWNPMVEAQAFERCHRLGQAKQVTVHRIYVENTVEQALVSIQERKRALAEATLTGDMAPLDKLSLEDLKAIFAPRSGEGNGGGSAGPSKGKA
jgi:SNF2 family DNA or RNA helicase